MMKKLKLPYNRQFIDEDDIANVAESLSSDFLTTGPQADLFERELANYTGAKYAIVCSNGTAALHLAMQALNIKKSDTVLTSPITFVADANAARFVGAQVAFADINKDNVNLDPDSVRKVLESRSDIKVVLPVHFAGHPLNMREFSKIAEEFELHIIEDGCHALGATYLDNNNKVGSCQYSTMSIFSFHPIKSITTGEGGAITTNDKNLYEHLLRLRSHGLTRDPNLFQNKSLGFSKVDNDLVANPWYYEMHDLAYNYRITDFQCALGRSQLNKLDDFVQRRNNLANIYRKELKDKLPQIVSPLINSQNIINAYHLFVVRIPFHRIKGGRASLMLFLKKWGVQTQVHYLPIYLQPYYKNYFKSKQIFNEAQKYYDECLSLPLFVGMKSSDPVDVVSLLEEGINLLWE